MIDMNSVGPQNAIRSAQYCFNKSTSDIILLGSSLILEPSESANRTRGGSKDSPLEQRCDCKCYEQEIFKRYGQSLRVATLGVPAAMFSDQYRIVRSIVDNDQKPKLLVITFGPRDFMDNTVSKRLDDTPVARIFSAYESQRMSLQNFSLQKLSNLFQYQKTFGRLLRIKVRRQLIEWTCKKLDRYDSLWLASEQQVSKKVQYKASAKSSESSLISPISAQQRMSLSLADYKNRYTPFDNEACELQINYLNQILATCSDKSIPVMLLAMPLTNENLQLLHPSSKAQIDKGLHDLCSKYHIDLVDMNEQTKFAYDSHLFSDSVHLNREGCEKFIADFADLLSQTGVSRKILHPRSSLPSPNPID